MSRRSRHHRRQQRHERHRQTTRRFKERRRSGWDMNLYRNKERAMIAGVCAGLADHLDVEDWVVRLVFVGLFLFTGSLMMFAYGLAWFLMAPRNRDYVEEALEYVERYREYRPKKVFRYSEDANTRLKTARERVKKSLRRIEDMESCVTSRQYQLNKEFSKLAD